MANCPVCGRENADGLRYCGYCGSLLGGTSSATEQRRLVSILFCDVVGSTQLGEQLDAEAVRGVLGRYFERMRSIR